MRRPLGAALRETPLSAAPLLLLALLLLPGQTIGATHSSVASPPTAASVPRSVLSTVGGPAPQTISPLVSGTTTISTNDAGVATNVAMNFTAKFPAAIALAPGDDANVTLSELVYFSFTTRLLSAAGVGFWAHYDAGTSTTVLWPEVVLRNLTTTTTVVDTAIALPNPGTLVFRMQWTHGYWWTFSTVGGQVIGSGTPTWQNGTYDLNASTAMGFQSIGGYTGAPMLSVVESGPTVPFPSTALEGTLSPVMQFNTTSKTGYQPLNGNYVSTAHAGMEVPMAGYDQCYVTGCPWKVGNDTALVNFPSPVPSLVTNGTLWGVAPPPAVSFHTWLGAETVDPAYMNATGVDLTIASIPPVLPPGGLVASHIAVLPINGTWEAYVGFADLNFTITSIGTYKGYYPFYAVDEDNQAIFGLDLSQQTGGPHTVSLQHAQGWWWSAKLDNSAQTWLTCFSISGCTGNGTILLNTSTAWGETNMTFSASPHGRVGIPGLASIPIPYSTQPMVAYYGNLSSYGVETSTQLCSRAGTWGTPFEAFAWSWDVKDSHDVLLGNTQMPWAGGLPPGTVLITNTTLAYPTPLANTTAGSPTPVWIGTAVSGTSGPRAVASNGGWTTLTVSVSSGGTPLSGATVSATDPLGLGGFSHTFQMVSAGTYVATFWVNKTASAYQWDNLTITAVPTTGATGTGTLAVLITPPVTVAAQVVGYPSGTTVPAGAQLTVDVWTNISGGGVANAFPQLAITSGDGTFGANVSVSTGFYQVPLAISLTPSAPSAQVTAAAVGGSGSGYNVATAPVIDLTIQMGALVLSPVQVTYSGNVQQVAAGGLLVFTVTVKDPNGQPVPGATVTFSPQPALTGTSTPTPRSTGTGVATWNVTAPATLVSATTYTITVSATANGYSASAKQTTTFTVEPPSGNNQGNGSNTASSSNLLLYAIVGVVIAAVAVVAILMMMRKKKAGSPPPQAWSPSEPGAQPGAPEPPAGAPPEAPPPS